MFKMLIADDEWIVRDGISNICDWAQRGIVLCPMARNGQEALQLIHEHKPDIVIIDIRMPFLTGLDVIEQIHPALPNTEFIILSAYGEFEYAKRAMAFGVNHYILKPCNDEKLLSSVDAVLIKLRNDHFIRDYVSGKAVGSEARTKCASILSIDPENTVPHSPLVCRMIQAVEDHLSNESLSLSFLAREILFTNADYLGKVFKREMEQNFSSFLQARRVQEAQYLLLSNPPLKIYEIARRCGYGGNTQYFSLQFKKLIGKTPTEYQQDAHH